MNKESDTLELRRAALNFLARREHSRLELGQKLQRRKDAAERITAVLNRLQEEGLQSDTRFAESYVRSRLAKGDGPLKLDAALQQRGVAADVSAQCLAAASIDWEQQLRRLWQKKYHSEKAEDAPARASQMRFLQSRGYPADLIMRLFD